MTATLKSDPLTIREKATVQVWTRPSWDDPWTLQPSLLVQTLQLSVASVPQATFRHHYGYILTDAGENYVAPLDLTNQWVKVEVVPPGATTYDEYVMWYGVLTTERRSHFGARSPNGQPAGDTEWTAYGVEYLLTRMQITRSYLWDVPDDDYKIINRPLDFNGFKTDRNGTRFAQPNKQPGADTYYFAADLSGNNGFTPEMWTAKSIVNYVISRLYRNTLEPNLSWSDPGVSPSLVLEIDSALDYTPDLVRTQGQTFFDILQQLFSYKRGLTWWIQSTGAIELGFSIKVASISAGDLDLTDFDRTIVANSNCVALDLYDSRDVLAAIEVRDQSTRYKEVVVTGGRQGAVFTVGIDTDEVVEDWTSADRQEYNRALSNHAAYATVDRSTAASWNDNYRRSELLRHVFTRFKIDDNWTGLAGTNNEIVWPDLDAYDWDHKFVGTESVRNIWLHGMRFLPYLPISEKEDLNTASTDTVDNSKPGSIPDFQKPIVVGRIPDYNGAGATAWVLLDSFRQAGGWDELLSNGGGDLEVNVRVHDNQFGYSLVPSGMPHMLQLTYDYFDDGISSGDDVGVSHLAFGDISYAAIFVTLYAHCDHEIRVQYPSVVEDIHDMRDTLVIRLGDRARYDYVAKGTVIGVTEQLPSGNGKLQTPVGRAIRDDRGLMVDLAFRAYQWYLRDRRALSLSMTTIRSDLKLGQLITRIQVAEPDVLTDVDGNPILDVDGEPVIADDDSNETVNSVVTHLSYDVEKGNMNVQTQFMEIDFAELAYV